MTTTRKGPVPKRSDQKLGHRTKAEQNAISRVDVEGEVKPPSASQHWDPIAREWFRSLGKSGQARFMEPSDWTAARFAAEVVSRTLQADKLSAANLAVAWQMMTDLLTTESARRRAQIEVTRRGAGPGRPGNGDPAADAAAAGASVTDIGDYRTVGYGS